MKEIALEEPLYEYIVQRFAKQERELLARMRPRAERSGLPPIMISEEQAKLVGILVRLQGSRRALDVGTLFGYSAAVLARAMGPKGRVVTLEVNPAAAKAARANFEDLGLAKRIEVREGAALPLMKAMRTASQDVVLVDADKGNYSRYLKEAVRLLRPGGLLLVDNTFAFGQVLSDPKKLGDTGPDVAAIQRFNDELSKREDLEAVLVPVGDGLAVARRA